MKKILLCVFILLASINVYAAAVDIEQLTEQANNGDADAQNIKQAIYLWSEAANRGDTAAQYLLGESYYFGVGVERDFKQAVDWHTKAAEQGHAVAQYTLGLHYANGDGVAKNYEEAMKWFTLSAQQKHPYALTILGYCYYEGCGVPRNNKLAYVWYTISLPYIPNNSNNDNIKAETVLEVLSELKLKMTDSEIAEAEQMAEEWMEKHK